MEVSYRDYCQAMSKLRQKFRQRFGVDSNVQFYEMSCFDEPVRIGVNWGAIGTVSPDKTREFSRQLIEAAEAAESFEYNGYTITYGEA